MHPAVSKRSQNGRFCAKKITLEAREAPNGLQTSNKWWYSMEYMQEDYPGRKTCRKNAPNGVKTVPKWLILGQNSRRTQVGQMMVLNGIHAGEHKQKSAIGNCWGIQCINTLCLFLTSIISHFSDAYIPFNAPVHAWRKNGKYDVCLVTGVHAFCVLHSFVYHHLFNF